jgi:hypothetical protein
MELILRRLNYYAHLDSSLGSIAAITDDQSFSPLQAKVSVLERIPDYRYQSPNF